MANRKFTLLQCYSALRIHKEHKKKAILQSALTNEVDLQINSLSQFFKQTKKKHQNKSARFQCSVLRTMMGKQLGEYF